MPAPANDLITAAEVLTGSGASLSGDLTEATNDAAEQAYFGTDAKTVYYRWDNNSGDPKDFTIRSLASAGMSGGAVVSGWEGPSADSPTDFDDMVTALGWGAALTLTDGAPAETLLSVPDGQAVILIVTQNDSATDPAAGTFGFDWSPSAGGDGAFQTAAAGMIEISEEGPEQQEPTWHVFDGVEGFSSRRGRATEFEDFARGELSLVLSDRDSPTRAIGDLDPTNSGSAFAPWLQKRRRHIRVSGRDPYDDGSGPWTEIYRGYTNLPIHRRTRPQHMELSIEAYDLIGLLAELRVNPDGDADKIYAAARVDDRIRAAIADATFLPADLTNIATGNVNVQESSYPGSASILEVILDAAEAEFPKVACFFVTKRGIAWFDGRFRRLGGTNANDETTTLDVAWQLGDKDALLDDPTLIPIMAVDPPELGGGDDMIRNAVTVYPEGTDPDSVPGQRVADAGSIAEYGEVSLEVPNLVLLDGAPSNGTTGLEEALFYAEWLAGNYANPGNRIGRVTVKGLHANDTHGSTFPFIFGVELTDLVEVTLRHPGGGGLEAAQYFVEGIQIDFTPPDVWVCYLDLSPRPGEATYPYGA